jgi:hypothetical protein
MANLIKRGGKKKTPRVFPRRRGKTRPGKRAKK